MTNFLFCDGHVKSMRPLVTGTPLNLWNTTNGASTTGVAPTALMNRLAKQEAALKQYPEVKWFCAEVLSRRLAGSGISTSSKIRSIVWLNSLYM